MRQPHNRQLEHEFYLDNNNQGEKEKTEQQDTPICPFEENNYVKLDDIVIMSGLKKKQVWKKIKKKKIVAYFDEDIAKCILFCTCLKNAIELAAFGS